jgi:transcriptional regulator with XRE-family HTH domain
MKNVTQRTLCIYLIYNKRMNLDWTKRARRLMSEQGVTQGDLVSVMGVKSSGAISHYLTGRNSPTVPAINALAKHLNVSPQLNEKNNLNLSEQQQIQLVVFIYNQYQKDEGVESISEKQILDTAMLLSGSLA